MDHRTQVCLSLPAANARQSRKTDFLFGTDVPMGTSVSIDIQTDESNIVY